MGSKFLILYENLVLNILERIDIQTTLGDKI